jgi:hypothetical protein
MRGNLVDVFLAYEGIVVTIVTRASPPFLLPILLVSRVSSLLR